MMMEILFGFLELEIIHQNIILAMGIILPVIILTFGVLMIGGGRTQYMTKLDLFLYVGILIIGMLLGMQG